MNASNRFWMVIVFFALLFALGGCKAAATETVVIENTAICPLLNFKELSPDISDWDSELGEVGRMMVIEWEFACSDPYYKGKVVAIQDFYNLDEDTVYWTGFYELVTDEGGVWKGTCENNMDGKMKNVCTLVGESKYKGLLLSHEYSIDTGYVKYRITREPEE